MPTIGYETEYNPGHPLDVIERMIADKDWPFERASDHEMAVRVPGRWCDHNLFFAWNDHLEAMHVSCAFDMRVPAPKRTQVADLLALVNDKLWLGHFCLWPDEGQPLFRHVLPLRGAKGPSPEQMEDVLEVAVAECERFYPAFQFVVWGGKTAQEALEAAMIDTLGEA